MAIAFLISAPNSSIQASAEDALNQSAKPISIQFWARFDSRRPVTQNVSYEESLWMRSSETNRIKTKFDLIALSDKVPNEIQPVKQTVSSVIVFFWTKKGEEGYHFIMHKIIIG